MSSSRSVSPQIWQTLSSRRATRTLVAYGVLVWLDLPRSSGLGEGLGDPADRAEAPEDRAEEILDLRGNILRVLTGVKAGDLLFEELPTRVVRWLTVGHPTSLGAPRQVSVVLPSASPRGRVVRKVLNQGPVGAVVKLPTRLRKHRTTCPQIIVDLLLPIPLVSEDPVQYGVALS